MPLADEPTRSSIQHYQGVAAVVDTRIMCMRPDITNLTASHRFDIYWAHLGGNLRVPDEFRSRPVDPAASWRLRIFSDEVAMSCSMDQSRGNSGTNYHDDDWSFTLCQLGRDNLAGLVAESVDMDSAAGSDLSYSFLAINVTGLKGSDELFLLSAVPIRNSTEGEWLHLYYEYPPNAYTSEPVAYEYRVSISMCFTALKGFQASINAHSSNNRTEPFPRLIDGTYRFDDVRKQFGQFGGSLEDRGVLELEQEDWIRQSAAGLSDDYDYIDNSAGFSNLSTPFIFFSRGNGDTVWASPDIAMFVQEILKTGGRLSFALQSVLTLLASMAYYDQTPAFDLVTPTNQTYFVPAQIPGGNRQYLAAPAGFRVGYTAVMCILALHSILVCIIFWMFFFRKSTCHVLTQ